MNTKIGTINISADLKAIGGRELSPQVPLILIVNKLGGQKNLIVLN